MEKKIQKFLDKKCKASIVLEMLLNREYVTGSDIIKHGCEGTPLVFTTCPQGLIKEIRDHFGYDFVQDREAQFFRTMYDSKGKPYKRSDTYKQYFLRKMEG